MVTTAASRRVDRRRQRRRGAAARVSPGSRSSTRRSTCRFKRRQVLPVPRGDARPTRRRARSSRATAASRARGTSARTRRCGRCNETLDLLLKAFPIRTCKDSDYRRAMASRQAVLRRPDRPLLRPVLGQVTIEEHRANVDRFVGVHGRTRTGASSASSSEQMRRRRRRAGLRDGGALPRPARRRCETVLREERRRARATASTSTCSASTHDELAAAVQQFIVRGGRVRGVRVWIVDKELDVPLGELVDSVARRTPTATTTPPPREVVVPELPDDADGARDAGSAALAGRKVRLRVAQRGDKAALLADRDAERQAGARCSTRPGAAPTSRRAPRRSRTSRRRSAWPTPRCASSASTCRTSAARTSSPRWSCSKTACRARTSTAGSRSRARPTTPTRSTRCSPGGWRTSTSRLPTTSRDGDAHGADGRGDGDDAAGHPRGARSSPTGRTCSSSTAASRRSQAAARALAESGVDGIYLCGIAKRLEEIWTPDADFPVILPRNSDALFLFQRVRDEAHRFAITHQRQRRKRDIGIGALRDPRARARRG